MISYNSSYMLQIFIHLVLEFIQWNPYNSKYFSRKILLLNITYPLDFTCKVPQDVCLLIRKKYTYFCIQGKVGRGKLIHLIL